MAPKKEFYPHNFMRYNCQYSMYVEIAVENYYYANDIYEKLEERPFGCSEAVEAGWSIDKFVAISVIFSAAAVEAFLNDYAAACIGDEGFYDNFDKLTVLSKLQLISQFIIGTTVDKAGSLYGHLKALERCRNDLIHSKSSDAWKIVADTHDERQEIPMPEELGDCDTHTDLKRRLSVARDGIKTLKELSVYFDQNDESAYAMVRLFMPDSHRSMLEQNHPLVRVLQDFQISTKE